MANLKQAPLNSGYGAATTAREVAKGIDLSGKTAIVTGGYSGLGLETARVLAEAGANVVIPARDTARALASVANIENAEVDELDLMNAASIEAFAERFLASGRALHILINSAGIMATPLMRDSRGYEAQFSTNHLGHFHLTKKLWPALAEAHGSRVVSVSSGGHQIAPVDFDDINFERRPYNKWIAYGQSKTANVLFAVALDKRGERQGIRAFALHPGTVLGPLARHLTEDEIKEFDVYDDQGRVIVDPERDLKNAEQGAATAVWCATSPRLASLGGVYCENCDVASVTPEDGSSRFGVNKWAIDDTAAERLWIVSERMIATNS
ncbi:oxidoreductase [Neorhizobium sp. CSC1952]|uniref:oxidoreductase n=1 Tax=Neorhizobium sp. CSC1952 TaxID=2978974 RepID=UPI0025A4F624|nr:oxidoreductase [Rhizobium sp. CSC1952]WJR66337.1 oxidoreductase [Rhizobium sp. CSC1952]